MRATITLDRLPTSDTDTALVGVGQTLVISNGTVTAKARVDRLGTYTSGPGDTSTQVVNIKVYGETIAHLPAALQGQDRNIEHFCIRF